MRRARKHTLLKKWGDGTTCPCLYCGKSLTIDTLTVDRLIPGSHGGRYVRKNVIPACFPCNRKRGDRWLWSYNKRLARRLHRLGYTVSATTIEIR